MHIAELDLDKDDARLSHHPQNQETISARKDGYQE
jgi:hypothetical protein